MTQVPVHIHRQSDLSPKILQHLTLGRVSSKERSNKADLQANTAVTLDIYCTYKKLTKEAEPQTVVESGSLIYGCIGSFTTGDESEGICAYCLTHKELGA